MNWFNQPDPLADYRHLGIVATPAPPRRGPLDIAWDIAEVTALLTAAGAFIWIGGM